MIDPVDPLLLFDEPGRMFTIPDPALADELIDSVDDFFEGFDGLGRPVRAIGEDGRVVLALTSGEPQEDALRLRVERYYFVFAARHPTRTPPRESDLRVFIRAVAEDWVEE